MRHCAVAHCAASLTVLWLRMELNKLIEELKEYITQHQAELDALKEEVDKEVTKLQAGNLDNLDHLSSIQMKHEAKTTTLADLKKDMTTMQTEVEVMLAKEGVRRVDTAQVWLNRYMSLVSVFSLRSLPALPLRVSISDLSHTLKSQSLINH